MAEEDGGQYDLPSAKKPIRTRLTPELMRAILKIESGGNPNARTGSYKGLYQLSEKEFARLGGRGDIFNPQENTRIASLKLQQEADQVATKLGRPLTPGEIYLVHQQGVGGAYEHLTHPERPAWQSMNATGEGRSKGEGWSRLAIWGNVPDKDKARYGSVDNLTSGEFTKMWNDRIARGGGGDGKVAAADVPLDPTPNVGAGQSDYDKQAADVAAAKMVDPTPNVGSGASDYPSPDPTLADSIANINKKDLGKDVGDIFSGLGDILAKGPVAQNAARPSSPATIAMPTLTPSGAFPTVDPRMADAQRQQLALAMQRLNSGRLV
jgi:hypothetical protein